MPKVVHAKRRGRGRPKPRSRQASERPSIVFWKPSLALVIGGHGLTVRVSPKPDAAAVHRH